MLEKVNLHRDWWKLKSVMTFFFMKFGDISHFWSGYMEDRRFTRFAAGGANIHGETEVPKSEFHPTVGLFCSSISNNNKESEWDAKKNAKARLKVLKLRHYCFFSLSAISHYFACRVEYIAVTWLKTHTLYVSANMCFCDGMCYMNLQ